MSEKESKLKMNLKTGEIEIEGTEEFIREQQKEIPDFIKHCKEFTETVPSLLPSPQPEYTPKESSPSQSNDIGTDDLPSSFGEFFNTFPRDITDTDKFLSAAYYVQKKDPDNLFTTKDANGKLKEQSIKLSNASDCRGRLLDRKIIFTHEGKYRVSRSGIDYLTGLLDDE